MVRRFEQIRKSDVELAGGKGANLGELVAAGLPVPPGFVVTAQAYLAAMEQAGARAKLRELVAGLDAGDGAALARASDALRALVKQAGMPQALREAVLAAYRGLGAGLRVAVRSSATMEDTAGASFAGMNETFTNVQGEAALLDAIVRCWMSVWGKRVIAYRSSQGFDQEPAIAVVVQQMVDSERSGVMFTADPASGDRAHLVIEGAFGLGEVVVGGQVEPDTYVLAKDGPRVLETRIGEKSHKLERDPQGGTRRVELQGEQRVRRVLDDTELLELARMGLRIEKHYGTPQDIEWGFAGGKLYCLQSRPITTLHEDKAGAVLLSGLGASPGRASGRVRILKSPAEGAKLQAGEVLVASMTSPDWVPVLRRAAALVTDGGGMTCHAAIVEPRAAHPLRGRHAQRDQAAARRRARHHRRPEGRGDRGRGRRGAGAGRGDRAGGGRARPGRERAVAGHAHLREPCDRGARRRGRRAAGGRRGAAARRIHDHGCALGRASQRADPRGRAGGVRETHERLAVCASRALSRRARSSTAPTIFAPTSSASCAAAISTSRKKRTR